MYKILDALSFKPCYKWNAFNTEVRNFRRVAELAVLNLVISGMPSIPLILLEY